MWTGASVVAIHAVVVIFVLVNIVELSVIMEPLFRKPRFLEWLQSCVCPCYFHIGSNAIVSFLRIYCISH